MEEAIYRWDTRHVEDLRETVLRYNTAKRFIEDRLSQILCDIDWRKVPRASNEKDHQLVQYNVLTIDQAGMCLMGPDADEIVHLDSLLGRPNQ